MVSPSATVGSLQARELSRKQHEKTGKTGEAFQNMAGTPPTLSAIHPAHAAATIVKIGAGTNVDLTRVENSLVQRDGEQRIPESKFPGTEDEAIEESDNLEEIGAQGPLAAHEGEESYACDRDPLALNLGHDSHARNGTYAQDQSENLSFGGEGSRLESWVRSSNHHSRGVSEQIPEHLIPEMQEWLRERGVHAVLPPPPPPRPSHAQQTVARRSGLGVLSLGRTKISRSPTRNTRPSVRNSHSRAIAANLVNSFQ